MHRNGEHYEYVAVYVDDLAFAMQDPNDLVDTLKTKYGFKIKEAGPLEFHLGADFYHDKEGVLCMAPQKYIGRLIQSYEQMFGKKPSLKAHSPVEKGNHPELDDSELLDRTGIEQYQSLLGSLQWAISLGRFDISTAVMTLSTFRAAPRRGHLQRLQRIVGYLAKMQHATINSTLMSLITVTYHPKSRMIGSQLMVKSLSYFQTMLLNLWASPLRLPIMWIPIYSMMHLQDTL